LGGRKLRVKEDELKVHRSYAQAKTRDSSRDSTSRFLTKSVHWNAEEKNIEFLELTSNEIDPIRSIFISNLAFSVSHKRLVQFLVNDMIMSDKKMELSVMKVKKIRFLLDSVGQSGGRAFVEFEHAFNAQEMVESVDRTTLQDRVVYARMMNEL
jgi:hypothetical protein